EEKIRNLGKGGKAWRVEMLDPLFFEAVRLSVKELEGTYALGVLWAQCPKTLIAARRQSPLILGIGDGGNFIASDIPAVLDHTRKIVFLGDGELAVLKPDSATVFNMDGKKVEKPASVVQWDRTMAEKGGYRHLMLKEIHEQPDAMEDTLRGRLRPVGEKVLEREFGITGGFARTLKEIQIVACGTAYHAGLVGRYALEHFARVPVSVEFASENRYREALLDADSLVIAVSQSGETADTLAAVREAKKNGLKTLAVCNVLGSSLTRECDFTFYTHCGPEIGVASTKAFIGQLTALYMLALHLGAARGQLAPETAALRAGELLKIPSLMRDVLEQSGRVEAVAGRLAKKSHFLFLGRGANFPIALEGALKIKEIAYVHAEGFAGGEMKHGPIAIIEEGMPVLGIAVRSRLLDKMLSNLQEAKTRGACIVGIVNDCARADGLKLDECLSIPEVNEYFSPFLSVIPLQLFAYYSAAIRGCDIDQPRNLAKSVTVE
ncbi:MAG: glutamine--fructose-6-phosphate transaminase (isomerizing), partial [Elusimicrobiales bacterium]|nr:glutamine--fructose-6-phosphate transaminase (isomerizing) [Elusimicrobiales bacterium]